MGSAGWLLSAAASAGGGRDEYALFQKAIRQEETVQEQAVEDDAEERQIAVDQEQTHEQLKSNLRLAQLKERRAQLREKRARAADGGGGDAAAAAGMTSSNKKSKASAETSGQDVDYESLFGGLQWRAKA